MAKITKAIGRQIIDSRGNPTLEAEIWCGNVMGYAAAPSGASTGSHEALELRDGGKPFHGKSVLNAVANINKKIAKKLVGMDASNQRAIDSALISLDGTPNKSVLGANATVAVSLAASHAAANCKGIGLYAHLGGKILPVPMMNVINGGMHAGSGLAIQEFMVMPVGCKSFSSALQAGCEIYSTLRGTIKSRFGPGATSVGDEGGFAPHAHGTEEAISLILSAIKENGYENEVKLAIDAAASSFFQISSRKYSIDGRDLSSGELLDFYSSLCAKYPIVSLEDPFHEDDFDSFAAIRKKLSGKVQVVGDDLTVTSMPRLQIAIERRSISSLLLKVNQVGTLSEALDAAALCKKSKLGVVVSHRSGETGDDSIADIAVGIGCGQIKAGAPCRGERTAKYNRLLRIEEELGKKGKFAGKSGLVF
jgi:enolase